MVQAKQMVEACGGALLWEKEDWSPEEQSLLPYAIKLLGQARAVELNARENTVEYFFSVDYVFDCTSQNQILPNLPNYRLV